MITTQYPLSGDLEALEARRATIAGELASAQTSRAVAMARADEADAIALQARAAWATAQATARRARGNELVNPPAIDPALEQQVRAAEAEYTAAQEIASECRIAHHGLDSRCSTLSAALRRADEELDQLRARLELEARTPAQADALVKAAEKALSVAQMAEARAQSVYDAAAARRSEASQALQGAKLARENARAHLAQLRREADEVRARQGQGESRGTIRARILGRLGLAAS